MHKTRQQLIELDHQFCNWLKEQNQDLYIRFLAMRGAIPDVYEQAPLLIELSPYLEDFVGELFGVMDEVKALQDQHHTLAPLYRVKRNFVQRVAVRKYKDVSLEEFQTLFPGLVPGPRAEYGSVVQQGNGASGESGDSSDGGPGIKPGNNAIDWELAFARQVEDWQAEGCEEKLEAAGKVAAYLSRHPEHREGSLPGADDQAERKILHGVQDDGVLFKTPKKLDPQNLLDLGEVTINGIRQYQSKHTRQRDGFSCTDAGPDLATALDEASYCIYCHDRKKDSCSKGLRDKKTGEFQQNAHNITLTGCPLEERISEMNLLKKDGFSIGALATAMIDNPLCAATGHRICNDCMKACIYQKQQPVDIPKIESRTLQDVLQLPYGFEIYNLLSRWNPLNLERPLPKPSTGHTVLVVGMGPAGFNLAHHLLQEGHHVVGIDGLKIEPLNNVILSEVEGSGLSIERDVSCEIENDVSPRSFGYAQDDNNIKNINSILENLDTRTTGGFGGVAEYGITVRWNKNNLTLIRMMLERRTEFMLMGGIRFGSGLDRETAFDMGFSHIALCMGAGRPTIIDMPNKLARGVRQASDFLMNLQLTGAARLDSPANLQVRLPVVVIGGGLTAIDTATEALAYYPRQVEKFLQLYEQVEPDSLEWNAEEREIAETFLDHARQLRRTDDKLALLQKWGGATVVYRKTLQESPSYRLNHEEVELAMEEGIRFTENLSPVGIEVDKYGAASHIKFRHPERSEGFLPETDDQAERKILHDVQDDVVMEARTILIAAGTKPNTVLAREDNLYKLTNQYFRSIDEQDNEIAPQYIAKPDQVSILTHKTEDGRFSSFFGDLHPNYAGNVVKAMASAKQGYPIISRALENIEPHQSPETVFKTMQDECSATVHTVNRLAPGIIEVVVKAPLAARTFQPGQFYRLQNFERYADTKNGLKLAMEGLAVTGASVDIENGLLSTIVLEMGGSSNLCARLKQDEPVVLMGPTGTPTEIPKDTTVILCGGGLGNAVLFSIGKAMRENGCKVIYFAGYKTADSRVKVAEIEVAADMIIWCCDEAELPITREQDLAFHGNIVEAMKWYANQQTHLFPGLVPGPRAEHGAVVQQGNGAAGENGNNSDGGPGTRPGNSGLLSEATHLIVIGSDRMMAAVAQARHDALKPYLNPDHLAVGSINSPMQCMMKEICAQCLQVHKDPETGKETVVFSCFNQDQHLDSVCFQNLNDRLKQNNTQEKLVKAVLAL